MNNRGGNLIIFVAAAFLIGMLLCGCTRQAPTSAIKETIEQNAQDAKKIIQGADTLELCKTASVAQIDAIVRQANDMSAVCIAELDSEKKDTRMWFLAFWAAVAAIFLILYSRIKAVITKFIT